MKKIFLYAALVGLCSFEANASEWTFEAFGKAKALGGYADIDSAHSKDYSRYHLPARFDANFLAQYSFDRNTQIGLYLDLAYGVDQRMKDYNHGTWGEQIYAVLDFPFGKLIAGQTYNVAKQLSVGAPSIGVLGVNQSDIVNFVANPNWQRNNNGTGYRALNSTEINTDGTALKISYITPELNDFMFGFSYIPNAYSRDGLISKRASYKNKDAYVFAGYHSADVGNVNVSTSLGFAQFVDNDKEISAGSSVYYKGWTIGASVRRTFTTDNDAKKNRPNRDNVVDFDNYRKGWAFNGGVSYEFGPLKSALTYFYAKSSRYSYSDEIIQFSNSFQYDKMTEFYASVAHGDFEGRTKAESNQGYAFILGVGVKF